MRNAVNYAYLVAFVIAIYNGIHNKSWYFLLFCSIIILWDIVDHYKEKAHNEHIDLLEKQMKYWHDKYMEEKVGKKESQKTTITICKN